MEKANILERGHKLPHGLDVIICDCFPIITHATFRVPEIWVSRLLILMVKTLCCLEMCNISNGQQVLPSPPAVSLEDLLTHPPAISVAIFEKEMFSESIPEAARKQIFSIKFDGGNYFLSVLSNAPNADIHGGRFNGVKWEAHAGTLTTADSKINPAGSALDNVEWVTMMTANMVVNMGIFEMIPGTAIWDKTQNRFMAKAANGGDLLVTVTPNPNDNRPAVATITEGGTGTAMGVIKYHYSQEFHNGQLPIEITRFSGVDPGIEKNKVLRIQILNLELADGKLSSTVMDPRIVLHTSLKGFSIYSNSVLYSLDKSGVASRMLTVAENHAALMKMKGGLHGSSPRFVRILILGFFVLTPISAVFYIKWKNREGQNNKKEKENK